MMMDTLRSLVGIEWFPVASLVIFVAVFTGATVRAWRADRAGMDRLAALPLDDERPAGASGPIETGRSL